MHPFLPVVTLVLNGMAALLTWYLYTAVRPDPQLLPHQNVFLVPIGFALVFGVGLGLWLWTRKMRFPLLISLGFGIVLWLALRFAPAAAIL